jgi:putative nucleotidyltransferase with HDIG domain
VPDLKFDIENITDLPSQPIVIQKLHALIRQPDVNNRDVARIIEADQGFAARVLRLANSSFYGFSRKISSVEEAIMILGFNAVHQLLLITTLLKSIEFDSQVLNLPDFWMHSFSVGVLAKHLLSKTDKETQDKSFIGGILHDVGRLALVRMDAERYRAYYSGDTAATDLTEERRFFGVDHQELGKQLAQKWNFPDSIQTIIAYHHSPLDAGKYRQLASSINMADMICHAMDIGNSGNCYITEFYAEAWKCIGLNMTSLEVSIRKALVEMGEIESILNDL